MNEEKRFSNCFFSIIFLRFGGKFFPRLFVNQVRELASTFLLTSFILRHGRPVASVQQNQFISFSFKLSHALSLSLCLSLSLSISLSLDALIYCVCLLILFGADNDQSNSIVQRSLFLYLFVCSSLLLRKSNYCIFSFSFSAFSYLLFVRSVRSRLTET